MKNFFKEFKEFIAKGDVMSMAIGIIIGSAFTAIVTSVVNDIITPIMGLIMGGIDFKSIMIEVEDAQILVGNFLQAVINFLITAFVLFLVVKMLNQLKRKPTEEPAAPAEPVIPEDIKLLTEIRDLLKKDN